MLQPYGPRLLVEISSDDTKSPGGIVLVDIEKSKRFTSGEVVAVGTGDASRDFVIGSKILFDKMTSNEVAKDTFLVSLTSVMATYN